MVASTAVGMDFFGFSVSSPSAAAISKPTNIKMANRMPLNTEPPAATLRGLNTSNVFPPLPPLAMMTMLRTRNGMADRAMIVSCVLTEICTPIRLTATMSARITRPHTHHCRSMFMCALKNACAVMPPMIGSAEPSDASAR